jgi:hypothetical protein
MESMLISMNKENACDQSGNRGILTRDNLIFYCPPSPFIAEGIYITINT